MGGQDGGERVTLWRADARRPKLDCPSASPIPSPYGAGDS